MTLYVEIHILQSFPPSNLNRNEFGAPKDSIFGGCRRARISSQCLKHAIRSYHIGKYKGCVPNERVMFRTEEVKDILSSELLKIGRNEASKHVDFVIYTAKLKLIENLEAGDLFFVGKYEIVSLVDLIDEQWDEISNIVYNQPEAKWKGRTPISISEKLKSIFGGARSIDLALYGRMLTDLPKSNQDAALQIAHAISTHRVIREFDYFTAIDDLNNKNEIGASMIGVVEFHSATFYRYAALNVMKLTENLKGESRLVESAIISLIESSIYAIPSGRQSSFAVHNLPDFVGVCLTSSPSNLANAFVQDIQPKNNQGFIKESVVMLSKYDNEISSYYGCEGKVWGCIDITESWSRDGSLSFFTVRELIDWACSSVKSYGE